jgi:hypothetical protein
MLNGTLQQFTQCVRALLNAAFLQERYGRPRGRPPSTRFPLIWTILISVTSGIWAALKYSSYERSRTIAEKKIERAEERVVREPEKTSAAWDLARITLQSYFDRNLSQVRMIFIVAIIVMAVGLRRQSANFRAPLELELSI